VRSDMKKRITMGLRSRRGRFVGATYLLILSLCIHAFGAGETGGEENTEGGQEGGALSSAALMTSTAESAGGSGIKNALGLHHNSFVSSDINLPYGTVVFSETDLHLPGRNGLDLVISRIYNSREYQSSPDLDRLVGGGQHYTRPWGGWLGHGWRFNFAARAFFVGFLTQDHLGDGEYTDGGFSKIVIEQNGSVSTYEYDVDLDRYVPEDPNNFSKVWYDNGVHLQTSDGKRYVFDTSMYYEIHTPQEGTLDVRGFYLSEITDIHDNSILIAYEAVAWGNLEDRFTMSRGVQLLEGVYVVGIGSKNLRHIIGDSYSAVKASEGTGGFFYRLRPLHMMDTFDRKVSFSYDGNSFYDLTPSSISYTNTLGTLNEINYVYEYDSIGDSSMLTAVQVNDMPAKRYEYTYHENQFSSFYKVEEFEFIVPWRDGTDHDDYSVYMTRRDYGLSYVVDYTNVRDFSTVFFMDNVFTYGCTVLGYQNGWYPKLNLAGFYPSTPAVNMDTLYNELQDKGYLNPDWTYTTNFTQKTTSIGLDWTGAGLPASREADILQVMREPFYESPFTLNTRKSLKEEKNPFTDYNGFLLKSVHSPLGHVVTYSYEDSLVTMQLRGSETQGDYEYDYYHEVPVSHATYPVVVKKEVKNVISGQESYTYLYNYPREEAHPVKASYSPSNSASKAYFFNRVEVDNPDPLQDEVHEFEQGLPVKHTKGIFETLTQWDFDQQLQTHVISKKAGVVKTEQVFEAYDAYRHPTRVITKVDGVPYLIQETTYYTNASFITNQLLHLVNTTTTREPGAAEGRSGYQEYNEKGQPIEVYQGTNNAGIHLQSMTYDAQGRPATQVAYESAGPLTTLYHYVESSAELETTTEMNGKEARVVYERYTGKPIRSTDVNGFTTFYAYDAYGRPTQVTYPDSSTDAYAYSSDLKMNSVTAAGRTVTTFFDNFGRVSRIDYPYDEEDVRYEYVFGDKVGKTYRKKGNNWELDQEITYDSYLRTVTNFSPVWGTVSTTYDDVNNTVTRTGARGRQSERLYDTLQRLLQNRLLEDDTTVTYGYDAFGQVTNVTDPRGVQRSSQYDRYGRVTNTCYPYLSLEDKAVRSETTYFNDGQVDRVSLRDRLGNLVKTYSYVYDREGRIRHLKLNGEIQETLSYDDGWASEHRKGRLAQVSNSVLRALFSYDWMGRLSEEYKIYNTMGKAFSYTYLYTDFGALDSLTFPDGKTIKYRHDHRNRSRLVKYDHRTIFTYTSYNSNGTVSSLKYGNGTTLHYTYDSNKEIFVTAIVLKDPQGNPIHTQTYGYDEWGLLTTNQSDALFIDDQMLERLYGYNTKDELMSVHLNGAFDYYAYEYDVNHNRTTFQNPFESTASTNFISDPISDQILERRYPRGHMTFAYDAEGNVTNKQIYVQGEAVPVAWFDYAYNYQGALVEVKAQGETIAVYQYDSSRQRIYSNVQGVEKIYHWNSVGQMIGEGTPQEDFTIRYIYNGNEKIAMIRLDEMGKEQIYYFVNNLQGTPILILDDEGEIVQRIQMDAYGNVERMAGMFSEEINFTGKQYDPVTRLYYFYQRYYDPDLGRFISHDPVAQVLNLYLYAGNNPLKYVDPNGKFWWIVGALVASYDWQKGQFKDFSKPQTWMDMAFGALLGGGLDLGIEAARMGGMKDISFSFQLPDLGLELSVGLGFGSTDIGGRPAPENPYEGWSNERLARDWKSDRPPPPVGGIDPRNMQNYLSSIGRTIVGTPPIPAGFNFYMLDTYVDFEEANNRSQDISDALGVASSGFSTAAIRHPHLAVPYTIASKGLTVTKMALDGLRYEAGHIDTATYLKGATLDTASLVIKNPLTTLLFSTGTTFDTALGRRNR